jgi:PRTRC genetic system protein C
MSRVFKYNGQVYEDPGPEYTPEEIRSHLATIYPEVAQADIQEKTLEDGTVEITFVKRAGTKG